MSTNYTTGDPFCSRVGTLATSRGSWRALLLLARVLGKQLRRYLVSGLFEFGVAHIRRIERFRETPSCEELVSAGESLAVVSAQDYLCGILILERRDVGELLGRIADGQLSG
jgi:hypothetical protein